jgi:hypothetical protein
VGVISDYLCFALLGFSSARIRISRHSDPPGTAPHRVRCFLAGHSIDKRKNDRLKDT